MNQRFLTVLIFAFLVAGGASFLLYRLMASRVPVKASVPVVQVAMAAREMPVGTLLKDSDLKMGEWTGALPATALAKKEDIVGRGVVATINEGELIMENRLAPKGAGAGMAAMIPQGMRAVAVRVNEVVGVAGFVVPGMRVDVLISGTPPNGNPEMGSLSKTLLQNVEVLSAGQNFQKDAEGKPVSVQVVNLLVTPGDAEMLSLASSQTTIQLVLRNPLDNDQAKTEGTAVSRLFGGMVPVAPPPKPAPKRAPAVASAPRTADRAAPPPPMVVEMFHGAKKADQQFQAREEAKQ
jgi:pilus assembly protein CpaB